MSYKVDFPIGQYRPKDPFVVELLERARERIRAYKERLGVEEDPPIDEGHDFCGRGYTADWSANMPHE